MIQQILRSTEMVIVRVSLVIVLFVQARDHHSCEKRRVPRFRRLSESFDEELYTFIVIECALDVVGAVGAARVVAACECEEAVHYHRLMEC